MNTSVAATLDFSTLLPGFSDPVVQSQTCFRLIMNSTACPGTLAHFSTAPIPPQGLNKAAGACLLTLIDPETRLWLDPSLTTGDVPLWLRFHTGAPVTDVRDEAAFALALPQDGNLGVSSFNQGDAKYPDRATTIVIMLPSLQGGPQLTLRGPGIETQTLIAPQGLSSTFWEERNELVSHFQFGIDLMLCAGDQMISLPRTTRITF
jgi:alpha-D-ribose 1-methylphosphonate 5-triphosphate synthase subunit PhnH